MRNNNDNKEKTAKKSVVITPVYVAEHIYKNLKRFPFKNILDVGCWDGSLSSPWTKKHNSKIIGIDIINDYENNFNTFIGKDFLETTQEDFKGLNIDLVITNPPFGKNTDKGELYPYLFIQHIFKLFGSTVPVVLISGHWFMSNSNNRMRYLNNANITRITTLHKRTFENCGVSVESNIIYFNIKQKITHDFLEYEKPTKKTPKQIFKSVSMSREQKIFINENIDNFSGEVKKLIKEKFEDFPI